MIAAEPTEGPSEVEATVVAEWRDIVHGYIEEVISGTRIAGKKIIDACKRHCRDLERAEADWPYVFDEQKAVQACLFFGFLKHTDGSYAGKPFILKPWQAFVVWVLCGWVWASTGFRRFKHAFISVGRGNGKSPFAAGLLLLFLVFDSPPEQRAEGYCCATKTLQARITFNQVRRYVEDSKPLSSLVEVYAHHLNVPMTRSELRMLSGEGKSADGLIIHVLIRDERHEWYGKALRKLDEKIVTALKKRDQPMLIDITTAGNEDSEMWQEDYDYLSLVVDQDTRIENDSKFVMIFEMDEGDDELDESSWHKANPMLEFGVVKIESLREMAAEAEWNPIKRGELRRYHANVFTSSAKMPITSAMWSNGNEPLPSLFGQTCYLGFDWGWKDDLASAGYVFPLDWVWDDSDEDREFPKRRYAVISDTWIPAGGNREIDREPWRQWILDGHLQVTDSEWTDTAAIYKSIEIRRQMYAIKSVAYDMNNGREFGTHCVNEFGLETYAFPQSHAKYNEPLQEFLVALHEGRIIHGGNPLLTWCALNLVTKENSVGLIMPWKAKAQDKIDPLVAILMGFSEAMFQEPTKPSVYETRGPLAG